jgi:hypothetical protein
LTKGEDLAPRSGAPRDMHTRGLSNDGLTNQAIPSWFQRCYVCKQALSS